MKKIIVVLTLLVMVCTMAFAPPAAAVDAPERTGAVVQTVAKSPTCDIGIACGDIYHYAPDNGFDDPIRTTCDWNNQAAAGRWVAEGQDSPCADTDGFYVSPGKTIVCWNSVSTHAYGATGWYKISDYQNLNCVHQLDD